MKPKLIYLSAFVLLGGAVFLVLFNVQKGNSTLSDRLSSKKPIIKFDKLVYDFGVAGSDAKPNHVFKFINDGQKELAISDVKSSCGCTAALLSQKNIPPGGDGEIKVTFDPKGYRGKIKKTVSVYSNDPNRSVVQLAIKGSVKGIAEVEPGQIDFGKVSNQEVTEKRIRNGSANCGNTPPSESKGEATAHDGVRLSNTYSITLSTSQYVNNCQIQGHAYTALTIDNSTKDIFAATPVVTMQCQ